MKKKRPTLSDVAHHAQVSTATVSRVLHNTGPASQDLRERVETSVAALGYAPRQASKRPGEGTIALLVGDLLNPFFMEIAQGVQDEANDCGLTLTVYNMTDHPQRQGQLLRTLSKPPVEGVILTGLSPFHELLEWQERHKLPLVLLNRRVNQPGVYCIMVDFENAMVRATQHLLGLSHTRVGYLDSPSTGEIAQARLRGIEAALAEAGLSLRPEWRPIVPPGTEVEGGFQAMRALLDLPADQRPTAVIAFNDIIALGALHAVRACGLRVPQDISIVGTDDISIAAHVYPSLTTIGQPKYRMGKLAVQTLRRMSEGRLSPGNHYALLESPLIVRQSTGSVPRTDSTP
ncbi:MAG: LacI family DNA-binding transcriptional regulator [Thermoflexales bacterium]|nr:LacI family DNA-binding transcriptional regulator [Thermoflexales bacterium]